MAYILDPLPLASLPGRPGVRKPVVRQPTDNIKHVRPRYTRFDF